MGFVLRIEKFGIPFDKDSDCVDCEASPSPTIMARGIGGVSHSCGCLDMTRRAGKRKNRMGVQPEKPRGGAKVVREHSLVEDGLKPAESSAIEMRAVGQGWCLEDYDARGPDGNLVHVKAATVRQQLLRKVAAIASSKSTDDRTVVAAFRALTRAEQNEVALQLRRERSELPAQVGVEIKAEVNAQVAVEVNKPVHQIIRELHARSDVREALSGGKIAESAADQAGNVAS